MILAIPEALKLSHLLEDHIVVRTHGTVVHLLRKSLDARHVNVFVLDEADNMRDLQSMGE